MRAEVARAVEELKLQFGHDAVVHAEDGNGGAFVTVDPVDLGDHYAPRQTWLGGHITAQYPYSDIYPVFIGEDVRRADGREFVAPITPNANFNGRLAIQISRRTATTDQTPQTAVAKFLKVLYFLEKLP